MFAKVLFSTVSKAFRKSINEQSNFLPSEKYNEISAWSEKILSIVEYPFLKPVWHSEIRLISSASKERRLLIITVNSFPKQLTKVIARSVIIWVRWAPLIFVNRLYNSYWPTFWNNSTIKHNIKYITINRYKSWIWYLQIFIYNLIVSCSFIIFQQSNIILNLLLINFRI